ncbi:Rpn family recombination-promoting nuclease/putative transposase [Vibrio atlanticus]|uniref:Rpn family recombination-promoting nuclease/putative transposase n=1 Tax=Vibrio TaxID=662 RepID=UPI00354EECD4
MEHQSRPDKHMTFRLMRYAIAARYRDIMEFLEPLVTLLLTDYTTDKQVRH